MPEVGIYLGIEKICITEIKEDKSVVNLSIPQARISGSESEQKIPDETEILTVLKDGLAKSMISPSNANVSLAGEDLIIRTFDLPIFLSRKELGYDTIAFEVKKYIPFRIEDLVFDFRLLTHRKDKKILVLFMGIRKKMLDKYLSIFKQLQIGINSIEYAGFSLLRLLRLGGLKDNGVVGFLNLDLDEEINFSVCYNGFPLFCRDIILMHRLETEASADEGGFGEGDQASLKEMLADKLKSEMRISLDFFRRKFPTMPIEKIIILNSLQFQEGITSFLSENLGISVIPLETSKFLGKGKDIESNLSLVKSYAVAISKKQRLRYPINFLSPASKKEAGLSSQAFPITITGLKINPRVIIGAFLIIILTVGWTWLKRLPLENELKLIMANRPQIEGVSGQQGFPALSNLERDYIEKIKIMERIVKDRFYLTEAMNAVCRLMPQGAWLTSFSFHRLEEKLQFSLEGLVFLSDPDKEFAAVNDIILGLKNDSNFNQHFKEINVVSMEKTELTKLNVEITKFKISCR